MTIPYMPGWGDVLQQTLPQIGQSLSQIANPNQDIQRALQMAIAQNPQIAQQLGNLDPAVTQGLFGQGKTTNAITSMGVDPGEQVRRKTAATTNAALDNPEIAQDVGLLNTVGQTGAARRVEKSKANVAEGTEAAAIERANQENQLLAAQLTDLESTVRLRSQALQAMPSLEGVNIGEVAYNIAAGNPVDQTVLARINADPVAKTGLDQFLESQRELGRIGASMRLEQLRQASPEVKGATIAHLQANINGLTNQWATAAKLANTEMTTIRLLEADAKNDKDPAKQAQAQTDLAEIKASKNAIPALRKQIETAQSQYNGVLAATYNLPTPAPAPKVSYDEILNAVKAGQIPLGSLGVMEANGELSPADAEKIRKAVAQPANIIEKVKTAQKKKPEPRNTGPLEPSELERKLRAGSSLGAALPLSIPKGSILDELFNK